MGFPILVGGCLIPVASQATSRGSKLFWIHFASTPRPAEDAAAGGRGRRGTRLGTPRHAAGDAAAGGWGRRGRRLGTPRHAAGETRSLLC